MLIAVKETDTMIDALDTIPRTTDNQVISDLRSALAVATARRRYYNVRVSGGTMNRLVYNAPLERVISYLEARLGFERGSSFNHYRGVLAD